MAKTIEIFKLDIDIDAVTKRTSELKVQTDTLKKSLDELKKSGDTSSQSYVRMKAAYDDVNKQYRSSQQELSKLVNLEAKEIKTVEQARNALSVVGKEWARQAELYGVNSKAADDLAKKKLELSDRLKELEGQTGDNTRSVGGYTEGMTAALNQTTLFGQAQSYLNSVLSIGKPVVNALKKEYSSFIGYLIKARQATTTFSGAQRASAIATNLTSAALKLLKIALISTGIGAIVVLLGSLVAWFSKTQAGIDLANKALAALGAAFDVIIDRASKFGGAIVKLFSGDWNGALGDMKDSFKGIGDEIAREVELAYKLEEQLQKLNREQTLLDFRRAAANTRVKELNKIIEDQTKSTEERIEAAKELEKIETDLAKAELENAEALLNNKLGKLEADKDSIALLSQLKEGTLEYDKLLGNLGLSESTDEDVKELLDLFKKAEEAQQRSFEIRTTNQNKLNTLLKDQQAKEEAAKKAAIDAAYKRSEAELKASKTILKQYIIENDKINSTLDERLKVYEKELIEERKILEKELKLKKITQEEFNLAILELNNEFHRKTTEATVQNLNEEYDLFVAQNQSKIDSAKELTQALVDEEKARLTALKNQRFKILQEQYEGELISEREFQTSKLELDAEFKEYERDLDDQYDAQKEEKKLEQQELENEEYEINLETRALRGENEFQLQLEKLEREKQAKINAAQGSESAITAINALYAEQRKKIEVAALNVKLQGAAQVAAGVAQIAGKESALGKAAAIAQATINTYQGATLALSSFPGPVGIAMAALTVASGLVSVAKIVGVKGADDKAAGLLSVASGIGQVKAGSIPKAEQGALFDIGGKRHYAGGTKFIGEDGTTFEAEQGELIGVMNRRAAVAFKSFNDEYRTTSSGRNFLAGGGFVQTASITNNSAGTFTPKQSIDYEVLAESIGQQVALANAQLPSPVVSVEDINYGQSNYAQVVNGANL